MFLRSGKMSSVTRTPTNIRPIPFPRTLLTAQPQPSLTAANLEITNLKRRVEELTEERNQRKKDVLSLQKELSARESELLETLHGKEEVEAENRLLKDQLQEQQRQINQQLGEDAKPRQLMDDHGLLLINSCVDLLEKQKDLLLQFKQLSQLNTNVINTDIDIDIIIEGSITVKLNLVDTHLTHVNNKLESPPSNTIKNQNMSLTNAVVNDIILNQNLNANTHILKSVVQKAESSEKIRINSTIISEMSIKNVILQLLGSFRFRPARFGSRGLLSGMSDFLMTSMTSLLFDGGGRIRMMTSCTSLPFDGGGWIRTTL